MPASRLSGLPPLDAWPGLPLAADVVFRAIRDGLPVLVWGDYDADGVCASVIAFEALREMGAEVHVHLPDRSSEGYGVNARTALPVAEGAFGARPGLVLTVDCGVTDVASVRLLKGAGHKVVVCDHHMPGDALPDADAICDPALGSDASLSACGAGLAFLLMRAVGVLRQRAGLAAPDMRRWCDLAGLATVADVVSLHGPARILAAAGVASMGGHGRPSRPGLKALKDVCGIARVSAMDLGFSFGPTINAAGRLKHARLAFDLLTEADPDKARARAAELRNLSGVRRDIEDAMVAACQAKASEMGEMPAGVVFHDPDFHHGVAGIVASRMAERIRRPVVVCSGTGDVKGSGRSDGRVHLHDALKLSGHTLSRFGGHAMAAGLSLAEDGLPAFREAFAAGCAEARKLDHDPAAFDVELPAACAGMELAQALEAFEPCGQGWERPAFLSEPLFIERVEERSGMLRVSARSADFSREFVFGRWRGLTPEVLAAAGQTARVVYTVRTGSCGNRTELGFKAVVPDVPAGAAG
jgi:single-stranded-DNA-specific exonuclease